MTQRLRSDVQYLHRAAFIGLFPHARLQSRLFPISRSGLKTPTSRVSNLLDAFQCLVSSKIYIANPPTQNQGSCDFASVANHRLRGRKSNAVKFPNYPKPNLIHKFKRWRFLECSRSWADFCLVGSEFQFFQRMQSLINGNSTIFCNGISPQLSHKEASLRKRVPPDNLDKSFRPSGIGRASPDTESCMFLVSRSSKKCIQPLKYLFQAISKAFSFSLAHWKSDGSESQNFKFLF